MCIRGKERLSKGGWVLGSLTLHVKRSKGSAESLYHLGNFLVIIMATNKSANVNSVGVK